MSFRNIPCAAALSVAALLCASTPASAVEVGGVDFAGSGFMTLGLGHMLGGTPGTVSDFKKPVFISDYAQGGVYEGKGGVQWKPDSKVGVQGVATFPDRRFSVTGQLVSRGAREGAINLEWLYASFKVNDSFTLQAGRKRIPMFYYSDTQDIGVALPWTHLPPQLYGWEAVNYNGVNLAYRGQWIGWDANANLLAGYEAKDRSGYWKVYRGRNNRTDVRWDNIVGGDLTLTKDWFETRLVYLQSKVRQKNVSGSLDADPSSPTFGSYIDADTSFSSPAGKQQIYGVSFNVDYENVLVRSEFIRIAHNDVMGYTDRAQILGVGYRLGKWTPMITVSNYRSQAEISAGADPDGQEAHRTESLTLRYDLTTSSAVKVQLDFQKDRSGPNYTVDGFNRFGNARLLTATYDVVF
ncbi:MAG: hypothetical protein JSR69_23475 [Proteobacteria bacterium]|nr:hypothetical protein [Pseudomonadota bacterium]